MSNYIIMYHGGDMDVSPEEGKKHRENFFSWIEAQGNNVVNPGSPFGKTKIVSAHAVSDGWSGEMITGMSVLKADSLDAAVEMVKNCPYLDLGGVVSVTEELQM